MQAILKAGMDSSLCAWARRSAYEKDLLVGLIPVREGETHFARDCRIRTHPCARGRDTNRPAVIHPSHLAAI